MEEEVALENLEKERELAQEEREALERGVEREKFFHDGLEEGVIYSYFLSFFLMI